MCKNHLIAILGSGPAFGKLWTIDFYSSISEWAKISLEMFNR